ncbi:HxlR family transcriptional regulator [Actinophytocola xinjiangensis]|uniref:HxlR family transcriptional regulator n=1 Tax=Actinophytocola xinjiangensis TaxID=485602 RepID=A0A7Z0WFU1_9PSEU|nr:helix-turn-helix domain-containing protein [Actinophytocola xinjiangensis]OLF05812.1 HxlR family transcriptional regulator [Actinophytocola xinjiangensis]
MSDVFHRDCPARELLGHLAGRWTVLVLTALLTRPHRFHELRTVVEGISDKSLTATLRPLCRHGLVHRAVGTELPPSVTYSVTPLGRGAAAALAPLLDWIRANADQILPGDER